MAVDILGNLVSKDDIVFAFSSIYKVTEIHDSHIRIIKFPRSANARGKTVLSQITCVINPKTYTFSKLIDVDLNTPCDILGRQLAKGDRVMANNKIQVVDQIVYRADRSMFTVNLRVPDCTEINNRYTRDILKII